MNYFAGEMFGTAALILLGAGATMKGFKSQNPGWMVITTGWGCSYRLGSENFRGQEHLKIPFFL